MLQYLFLVPSRPVPSGPISSPSVRLILVLFTECVLDLLFCNYILLICFKGATFPWSNFVPIGFHVQNNLNWLDIIAKVPSTLEFNGVALTGWSRYSICRPSMIGLENEISKWLKPLETGVWSSSHCVGLPMRRKFPHSSTRTGKSQKMTFLISEVVGLLTLLVIYQLVISAKVALKNVVWTWHLTKLFLI